MDFTKFVSLLDSESLFFTRADKFNDPFEGSWPTINVANRSRLSLQGVSDEVQKEFKANMEALWARNKNWPKYHAINCWHMNNHESAAMWKLYLKSEEGIAIQSQYVKLKNSIIRDEPFYLGLVNYIDYERDIIPESNILSPFVHKRKSFEHEREVRALIMKWPITENGLNWDLETMAGGVGIKVELRALIEKVYVAPGTPTWFADLVHTVIGKYGFQFDIVHSNMDATALF